MTISSAPKESTDQADVPVNGNSSGVGGTRLNLGGRGTIIRGFQTVDLSEEHDVQIKSDVSNLWMFKDGTVDEIYASHILEHFSHVRTQYVLEEWRRVLKKGARAAISVPDFDAMVKLYVRVGMNDFIRNMLYGDQGYDRAYHYTGFTFSTLAALCVKSGFSDVKRIKEMPYGVKDCSQNVDTMTRQSVSINIEAVA